MKKILIVDDEANIRYEIEYLVRLRNDFGIVESCGQVDHAVEAIERLKPDVVLLDIQLSKQTAFEMLNKLPSIQFQLIFITAYNHYAIKAIKYGALDYLLKPIDKDELNAALDKTIANINAREIKPALEVVNGHLAMINKKRRIVLRTQQALHVVDFDNIIYCQSDGSYTTFYLNNGKNIMVSKPIKFYEELLPTQYFIRCHQSYLVNFNFIERYDREGLIFLKNGNKVLVSVRKKDKVIDFLTHKR